MSNSKEDTLNSHLTYGADTYDAGQRPNILSAMDEHAKNSAIAFAEWMDHNCVKSVRGWFLDDLIDGKVENEFTIPELYDFFLTHQSPQK